MIKILKFFLPFVFRVISSFSIGLFGILGLLGAIHADLIGNQVLGSLFIWIIFPAFAFYNSRIYLPSHVKWLLLTPVKKTHIIYANIIINLIKCGLLFLVGHLAWGTFYSELSLLDYLMAMVRVDENSSNGSLALSSDLYTFMFLLLAFIFLIVGSIFPKFSEMILPPKNYIPNSKYQWTKKSTILFLISFFILIPSILIYFWDYISPFFPEFVVMLLMASFLFTSTFFRTLSTLNIFYNDNYIFLLFFVIFIGMFGFGFSNSYLYITDSKTPVAKKISEAANLGIYSSIHNDYIEGLLTGPTSTLAGLRESDFSAFFKNKTKSPLFYKLLSSWENECLEKNNVACRLAGYMIKTKDGYTPLKLVRKSCPEDPQSCYVILIHKDATSQDVEMSKMHLESSCKDYDPFERKINTDSPLVCCQCFKDHLRNKRIKPRA